MHDTGLLLRALAFAAERHSRQRREDAAASPYINHPIALADVLANEGRVVDVVVQLAATLGAVEDKTVAPASPGHRLVLRGEMTLGGLEIKN